MDSFILNKLLFYNAQGLIPGPSEEIGPFFERVAYCLSLNEKFKDKSPLSVAPKQLPGVLDAACEETFKLYDFSPSWVPLFFCNDQLLPWHGGCTWIFNEKKDAPTGAFLQIRAQFKKATKYLGLYQRQELLCHELIHVARMMFDEPKFEEILAYRTSRQKWRRWWGPLFSSAIESLAFVISLGVVITFDGYFLFFSDKADYWHAAWLKLIPVVILLGAIIRLAKRQRTLWLAAKKLTILTGSQYVYAALCRLTDKEIIDFAGSKVEEIKHYAKMQKSIRWQIIKKAYFT